MANEGARIDAANAHQLMGIHPRFKGILAAPIAEFGCQLPSDDPTSMGRVSLLIIGIHTGIPKLGIDESH